MSEYKLPLLGIAGMSSSGKDTIGNHLADKLGWAKVALSDIIRQGYGNPGISDSTIRTEADFVREKEGYDALARWTIEAAITEKCPGLILTSVRHPAEATRILEHGGKLMYVAGDFEFLYERRKKRDDGRPLPSLEKFVADQQTQFVGEGPFLNLTKVRAMIPDEFRIWNNYKEKKDLIARGEEVFLKLFPELHDVYRRAGC